MSVIVGIKEGKKIYMGCDSAATTDEGFRRHIKVKKLFRKGKYLIGVAGSVRIANLMQSGMFSLPKTIDKFPEVLRNVLMAFGAMSVSEEDKTQSMSSNILIAVNNGELYEILSDFQLNEINNGYAAVGSGGEVATGCLFGILETANMVNLKLTSRNKLEIALKAACYFHGMCHPPFVFEEI